MLNQASSRAFIFGMVSGKHGVSLKESLDH